MDRFDSPRLPRTSRMGLDFRFMSLPETKNFKMKHDPTLNVLRRQNGNPALSSTRSYWPEGDPVPCHQMDHTLNVLRKIMAPQHCPPLILCDVIKDGLKMSKHSCIDPTLNVLRRQNGNPALSSTRSYWPEGDPVPCH